MRDLAHYISLATPRAEAGIRYLDHLIPDWATRMEKPVNIASSKECALAQLFGRFRDGALHLDLDEIATVDLGFRGTNTELRTMKEFTAYYKVLSAVWERERKLRLDLS